MELAAKQERTGAGVLLAPNTVSGYIALIFYGSQKFFAKLGYKVLEIR